MARVFVSSIGLGPYATATYSWDGRSASPTAFAQTAIIQLLGSPQFDRIVLLCTKESFAAHFRNLRQELIGLGCDPAAIVCPVQRIPTEMNNANQWQWFESLLGCVDAGDVLTFDFTHGIRAVPIVFSSAIGFLERAKDIELEHVLYAWYDNKRPPEVPHPIVDMREFYAINDWADAVGRLTEDADARKLGSLAATSEIDALQDLGAEDLVQAFQAMTDTIRNVDVNNIAARVNAALQRVDAHRSRSSGTARVLLDRVWEKFKGLAFGEPASGRYDAPYFQTQITIIRVLLEHRLFMQAFTAMRECIGSIGMAGLPSHYAGSMQSAKGRRHRRFASVFINMIQFAETEWNFEGQQALDVAVLHPWYDRLNGDGAVSALKDVAEKRSAGRNLLDYRNGFDHAWTSSDAAPEDIAQKGTEYLENLARAVTIVASLTA